MQNETTSYWLLRAGAALCFIGHGAFGFITKAAWLPYFAVVGIPESWAWRLMPLVGAVDVLAGMAVLFAPRGLPVIYMVVWAAWTALLRPLAGESVFETLERAGNYGVPLAFALMTGMTLARASLLKPLRQPEHIEGSALLRPVLQWTTVLLLLGHGALGVLNKPGLTTLYASVALPSSTTVTLGWLEIGLALLVALRPSASLLVLVAVWKLATESLWITAGAPIWEFIERAGSYAAPLALAALSIQRTAMGRHATGRAISLGADG